MIFLILCGLAIVSGAVFAFYVGVKAYNLRSEVDSQNETTLFFLVANLWEPLVNTFIIGFMLSNLINNSPVSLTHALLLTSPMAVLLLPVFGIFFRAPLRLVCIKMVLIGLLRWTITAYIIVASLTRTTALPNDESLMVILLAGFIVLWASAVWGRSLLRNTLRYIEKSSSTLA